MYTVAALNSTAAAYLAGGNNLTDRFAAQLARNLAGDPAGNSTANFAAGNDTATAEDYDFYQVPPLLVVVLSVLYGSISVIAVAGNGLVIWAILTSKRMRSVTNHFLANLAFADILIALFAIPFEVSALAAADAVFP